MDEEGTTMSAVTAEPTDDRMLRLANELAELVRQSPRPDAAWNSFVALMADQHRLDARRLVLPAATNGRATDPDAQAYLDRTRTEFTRADAEAFADAVRAAQVDPARLVPLGRAIAVLETIQDEYERGEGRP